MQTRQDACENIAFLTIVVSHYPKVHNIFQLSSGLVLQLH